MQWTQCGLATLVLVNKSIRLDTEMDICAPCVSYSVADLASTAMTRVTFCVEKKQAPHCGPRRQGAKLVRPCSEEPLDGTGQK